MKESMEPNPEALIFETIGQWPTGRWKAEDLVQLIEAEIATDLNPEERAELLARAQKEIDFDKQHFGKLEDINGNS